MINLHGLTMGEALLAIMAATIISAGVVYLFFRMAGAGWYRSKAEWHYHSAPDDNLDEEPPNGEEIQP